MNPCIAPSHLERASRQHKMLSTLLVEPSRRLPAARGPAAIPQAATHGPQPALQLLLLLAACGVASSRWVFLSRASAARLAPWGTSIGCYSGVCFRDLPLTV